MPKQARAESLVHITGDRSGATVELRGRRVLDFGSFDPLMLGVHPRVMRKARQALEVPGAISSPAPRRSTGTHVFHVELETRLARFFGFESALIFSSRNQAILSYFSQVLNEGDLILVDELVQAPIIDVAHLMGAVIRPLAELTTESVRREAQKVTLGARCFLYVESTSPKRCETVETAFIEDLLHVENLHIVLDESYSVPVVGIRGAGVCESPLLSRALSAVIVDTGISFGIGGAALVSKADTVGGVLERSMSLQVESSTSPLLAAALEEAISIAELSSEARAIISTISQHLRLGLLELGLKCAQSQAGALVSIPHPSLREAQDMAEALFQKGIYVESVPRGTHLHSLGSTRFAVRSAHTVADVDQVLSALSEILKR